MPWRVPFENGDFVDVDTKDKPTDEEIKAAWEKKQKEVPSPLETAGTEALMSLGPSVLGTGMGEYAMGMTATVLASQPELAIPAALLTGGLVGSGSAVGLEQLEQLALGKSSPELQARVQRGREANPKSAILGSILSPATMFELNPAQGVKALRTAGRWMLGKETTIPQKEQLVQAGLQGMIGATQGALQPLYYGQPPSLSGAAQGAGLGLLYGHPRTWWRRTSPGYKWLGEFYEKQAKQKEDNARSEQEAAKVHGNVPAQSEQGPGEMPVEEGEPRVQPQTEGGMAEGTQVSLNEPEYIRQRMQDALNQERTKRGLSIYEGEVPFAEGEVFKAMGNGKMALNQNEFDAWVSRQYEGGLDPAKIEENIRAKVRHELIHDRIFRVFPYDASGQPNPAFAKLWSELSPIEQEAVTQIYGGRGKSYTPAQMGMEAYRMRVEEAFGPKDEFRGRSLGKLWNLKSIDTMARMVRGIREGLSGNDSATRTLYDRALSNINWQRELNTKVAREGEAPPVLGREAEVPPRGGPGGQAPAALTPEGEELTKWTDEYMKNFAAVQESNLKLRRELLKMGRPGMLFNASLVNAEIMGEPVSKVLERLINQRDFPELVKSVAKEYLQKLDTKSELERDPRFAFWSKLAQEGTEKEGGFGYQGEGTQQKEGPVKKPDEGGFAAARSTYYGEEDLIKPGTTFGPRGWIRPDGQIIKVPPRSNHDLYAKTKALEQGVPGAFKWSMGQGLRHMFSQGYIRLNLDHDSALKKDILHLTGGEPNPAQWRSLKEIAQEHSWILRDANNRDVPAAKTPPPSPPPPPGAPHGVPPIHPTEPVAPVEGVRPPREEPPPTAPERPVEVVPEETFAPEGAPPIVPETNVPLEERGSPLVPLTEEQMMESRGVVPTGAELKPIIEKAVQAAAPNYKKFLNEMKQKFGPVQGGELAPELFQIYMWRELMSAPPERLAKLVSETGVGSAKEINAIKRQSLSAKSLEEMGMSVEEAEETAESFKSVSRRTKLTQEQLETLTERLQKNERLRNETRAIVGAKIMRQILADELPSYTKKNVTFEDLDFNNPLAKFPGYHEFTPSEAGSPRLLEEIMSDRARSGSGIDISVSNRLAVLRNRNTGEVEVRSVYKDPRRGMVIHDPSRGGGRSYIPIAQVPENLAFHATMLTEEPLSRFYQKFSSPVEFNNAIQRPRALEMSTPLGGAFTKRFLPIESLEAIGEGGSFTGPEAELIRALYGIGPGELEKISRNPTRFPMEAPEPNALYKMMRAMEVSVPEDVGEMIRILDHLMERRELEPWHYQGMAALLKMADAIQAQAPEGQLNREQLLLATIHAAYESFKNAKTPEEFVHDLLLNYDWQRTRLAPEAGPTTPTHPQVAPLARRAPAPVELAYEKPSTAIPTHFESLGGLVTEAVKAESKPFIGPTRPRELPTATPGTIPGPEMLAESVRRAIEEMPPEFFAEKGYKTLETSKLLDITKVKPTGTVREYPKKQFGSEFGPEGKVIGPTEQRGATGPDTAPAARIAEDFKDEVVLAKNQMLNWIRRSTTRKDIRSLRDGMDRRAELYAVRGSNKIRMASGGGAKASTMEARGFTTYADRPEFVRNRKSVIPYQAAMQMTFNRARFLHDMEAREWRHRQATAKEKGQAFDEPEPTFKRPSEPDPQYFDELAVKADKGIARAQDMLRSPNVEQRRTGKKYLAASKELRELATWTRDNFQQPVVRATNNAFRDVIDSHLGMLLANHENIANREYFIPSVFSGELWDDGMFTFGDERLLPATQQMPRAFMDPYEAVEAGPYVPVNLDSAVLAQRSLVQGARRVNLGIWADLLKGMTDRPSGKPVAISPRMVPEEVEYFNEQTGRNERHLSVVPRLPRGREEYRLVDIGKKPVGVRISYAKLVDTLMADSQIPEWPGGKALLHFKDLLKHGVLTLFDTFHPVRLVQYAGALGGSRWSAFPSTPRWKRGWSALSWSKEDLPRAVEVGLIPKEAMQWALEPIKVYDRGHIIRTTRHDLAERFLTNGLNATQQADALYRTTVQRFPVIGPAWYKYLVSPISKFTFDRLTPGFILDNAMSNFERLNARNRTESIDAQMRMVSRDVNAFYGNMGRQGFFQNPTFRDFAQMFVLAPMWQEGLLRKEIQTVSRLTGVSRLLGREGDLASYLGPLSAGMMRGLGAYFLFTQALNLITRRQFTWQNKEENHEMDAYVPLPWAGKNTGLWVSPLGVFGEWMHDYIRLHGTKPNAFATLRQIAMNKSGPYGRVATILWTQRTPSGEAITSTSGVAGAVARELAPAPIALGSTLQAGAHALGVPGAVPPQPGQNEQRLAASLLGTKTQISSRSEQDISLLADRFMKQTAQKLEPYELVATDAPSYVKLRAAIRNGDMRGARTLYAELVKQKTPAQITHAMWLWSRRPFTGNKKSEQLFLYSLNNAQLENYFKATGDKMAQYEAYLNWVMTQ